MPSISYLLRRMRQRHSAYYECCAATSGMKFYCMCAGKPHAVPKGTAKAMAKQLQFRNVEKLREHLLSLGILEKPPNACEQAPLRFNSATYMATWHTYCLVWMPRQDGPCQR